MKKYKIELNQDELDLIFEVFGEAICIGEFYEDTYSTRWNTFYNVEKKLNHHTKYQHRKHIMKTISKQLKD